MKTNNVKSLRMLTALNEIYENTQVPTVINFKKILQDNKVSYINYVKKVMLDNNIIETYQKEKQMQWVIKWNGIKPNLKMAEKIIIESKKTFNNAIPYEPNKQLEADVLKTLNFLLHIYELCSKEYNFINKKTLAKEFDLKNRAHIAEAFNHIDLVKVKGRQNFWHASKPTYETALKINEIASKIGLNYIQKQRSEKKEDNNNNLTTENDNLRRINKELNKKLNLQEAEIKQLNFYKKRSEAMTKQRQDIYKLYEDLHLENQELSKMHDDLLVENAILKQRKWWQIWK